MKEAIEKAEIEAHAIASLIHNPYTVARALLLYRYNVPNTERVKEFMARRWPGEDHSMSEAKWFKRFGGLDPVDVPQGFDVYSHIAFVACAMARYGEEASQQFGGCGLSKTDELLQETEGRHAKLPSMLEMLSRWMGLVKQGDT